MKISWGDVLTTSHPVDKILGKKKLKLSQPIKVCVGGKFCQYKKHRNNKHGLYDET